MSFALPLPNPFNRPLSSSEDFETTILVHVGDILAFGAPLERRALVDRIPAIGTVHVYPDHNPPHFHIRHPNFDLSVNLKTCEILRGPSLTGPQRKGLEKWFFQQGGRKLVIEYWNVCNPENANYAIDAAESKLAALSVAEKDSEKSLKKPKQIEATAKKKGGLND